MNINDSLTAYKNIGSVKTGTGSAQTTNTSSLHNKTLSDYLEEEKQPERSDSYSHNLRPTEGALNLEPLERYRYMLNQAKTVPTLNIATNDPKETIKKANEIINNAIMPTGEENPDMAELTRALQVKQLMQGRLDIAA